jgi:trimeric autotransporter adhesin
MGAPGVSKPISRPPNTEAFDVFGFSVALDGNTLGVGALRESSNGQGVNSGAEEDNSMESSGAVYVFTRRGGTWRQQAYIKASNTGAGDEFGRSVALSDDTLAVGAPFEASNGRGVNSGAEADNSALRAGAVYVFARHGDTWHQQAYIKASDTESRDNFGASVALNGDTLAVGAHEEFFNSQGGAVYIFTESGGAWYEQTFVRASNAERDDRFGSRIALDGDMLAVGAPAEESNGRGVNSGAEADNSAPFSGAVYVGCVVRTHSQYDAKAGRSKGERCGKSDGRQNGKDDEGDDD